MSPQEPPLRALPTPSPTAIEGAVHDVFASDADLAESLRAAIRPKPIGQSLLDWLRETWQDLLDGFESLHRAAPLVYWLVFAGLIVILALLLWHVAWTLKRAWRDARMAESTPTEGEVERRRRHTEWLSAARERAAAGDVRDAVRMLVLSLLALLEERHVLHYASSWTTREILARLAARIGVRPTVSMFGAGVERASYGATEPRSDEYERLEAAMLELAHAAEQVGEDER